MKRKKKNERKINKRYSLEQYNNILWKIKE